jgi:putative transposase
MTYYKSSSAVFNINYHIVWCPKYRSKVLVGNTAKQLKLLLETICKAKGWTLEALEIQPDHVHVFISCMPYENPTAIVKVLKGVSAIQLFKAVPELSQKLRKGHLWSPSYYVGTAGNVSADTIQKYIQNQKGQKAIPPPIKIGGPLA